MGFIKTFLGKDVVPFVVTFFSHFVSEEIIFPPTGLVFFFFFSLQFFYAYFMYVSMYK